MAARQARAFTSTEARALRSLTRELSLLKFSRGVAIYSSLNECSTERLNTDGAVLRYTVVACVAQASL